MRDDPSPWRKARTVVKLKGRGIGGLAAWSGVACRPMEMQPAPVLLERKSARAW